MPYHRKKVKEWRQAIATSTSHPRCWSYSNFIDYVHRTWPKTSDTEVRKESSVSIHLLLIYSHLSLMPCSSSPLKDLLSYSLLSVSTWILKCLISLSVSCCLFFE